MKLAIQIIWSSVKLRDTQPSRLLFFFYITFAMFINLTFYAYVSAIISYCNNYNNCENILK